MECYSSRAGLLEGPKIGHLWGEGRQWHARTALQGLKHIYLDPPERVSGKTSWATMQEGKPDRPHGILKTCASGKAVRSQSHGSKNGMSYATSTE